MFEVCYSKTLSGIPNGGLLLFLILILVMIFFFSVFSFFFMFYFVLLSPDIFEKAAGYSFYSNRN